MLFLIEPDVSGNSVGHIDIKIKNPLSQAKVGEVMTWSSGIRAIYFGIICTELIFTNE